MLPYEIFADSFFHETYKYHYRQAKWRLHRNDFVGAAYEIRSAGSYLNLIVVNWPDTSKVKLESAGNKLKELASSVESGTVKDTMELDLLVQKIVPTVTSDKK
jgi:hypothetical protein